MDGVEVTLKRVPELLSDEKLAKVGGKLNQAAPVADPKELADYDAFIFGTPTVSETWPLRCGTFSIRLAACGSKEHSLQSRQRLHEHRHWWGQREHDHQLSADTDSSRHDLRRFAVCVPPN